MNSEALLDKSNDGLIHGIETDRVRAVVFDLGGVLFEGNLEKIVGFGRNIGLKKGDWDLLFRELFLKSGPWEGLERGEITLEAFSEILREKLSILKIDLDMERLRIFLNSPAESLNLSIRSEVVEACANIRKIMPTVLLTNNIAEWREAWRSRFDLAALFNHVIDSSEVGMRKPDPPIYQLVEDKLGLAGEVLLFIDDLGINLKPARARGWQTLKYQDTKVVLEVLRGIANGSPEENRNRD